MDNAILNKGKTNASFQNHLASRLEECRKASGLTTEQAGALIGVAESTYSNYEKGNRELGIQALSVLAKAFGVDCEYLINGTRTEYLKISEETGLSEKAIENLHSLNNGSLYGDGYSLATINRFLESDKFNYCFVRLNVLDWRCSDLGDSIESAMQLLKKYENVDVSSMSAHSDDYINQLFDIDREFTDVTNESLFPGWNNMRFARYELIDYVTDCINDIFQTDELDKAFKSVEYELRTKRFKAYDLLQEYGYKEEQ